MSVSIDASSSTYHRERGNASFRRGAYDEAVEAYARAIESRADDCASLTNASAAYMELGRYDLAEAAARRALEANAAWRKGYARLARALERQGRARDACDVYRRGIEVCGESAQMQERLDALEESAAMEDASPEALKERGNAFLRDGDLSAAEEAYTLAIDKSTASGATLVALYNNRAETRRRAREHEAAVEDCTKALELDPINLKAILRRGGTYEVLEKYKRACDDYERALAIDPRDPFRVRERLRRCQALAREQF